MSESKGPSFATKSGDNSHSSPVKSALMLMLFTSVLHSRQKPMGKSRGTSRRHPSMPSEGSPSSSGSIQRLVMSKTCFFGSGCMVVSSRFSSGSELIFHQLSYVKLQLLLFVGRNDRILYHLTKIDFFPFFTISWNAQKCTPV